MKYTKFNRGALGKAFDFYARAIAFPYDELTHELQNIFRQIEKNVENEYDNTVAIRVLNILNYYQGEEIRDLQAEYTRLFSTRDQEMALISLNLGDWLNPIDLEELQDRLLDLGVYSYDTENPDFLAHVLEYFASIIDYEDESWIIDSFRRFLQPALPALCREIYQHSSLTFFKEYAKGLHDLMQLMHEALEDDEYGHSYSGE